MRKNSLLSNLARAADVFPNKIALLDGREFITYKELTELTDQYASHISAHSTAVGKEGILPIIAARNLRTVLWMISCVKAGVPFLNINGDFPVAYIKSMLEQVKTSLCVVTAADLLEEIQSTTVVEAIDAYAFSKPDPAMAREGKGLEDDPERIMYTVSTSGTTGVPKIALIPERAFMNYSDFVIETHQLCPDRRPSVCLLAPNFDVFIKETLIPLQQGMTVRLLTDSEKHNPAQLAAVLNAGGTHWLNTTYTFYQTIEQLLSEDTIEHLIFVGEALGKLADKTFSVANKIWNEYGPAECTIGITIKHIVPDESVSIGSAIHNNEVLIMDREEDIELGPHSSGELVIVGANVGFGYLHRSDNDQYGVRRIRRLGGDAETKQSYRTRDIGYKDDNGVIYFEGRVGRKVKIRGQWVHLHELESRIESAVAIDEVRVFYHEVFADTKSLVAYLRLKQEQKVEDVERVIRETLREKHNQYEIPDYFVPVAAYPYGKNDKLDEAALKRACAEHVAVMRQVPGDGNGARSELHREIRGAWEETLKHGSFTNTASFFDSGGNSLLVHQLLISLHDRGYNRLTIRDLHEQDSVDALSAFLGQGFGGV
ncbi:MAG: non-ribosomal peptide synthetase [Proteobacteria bacterium]|nr:non-ribosomal peptide synthetase [Pseudomonadota bacterium]